MPGAHELRPICRPQLLACPACKKGLPLASFAQNPDSGSRRKLCDSCVAAVKAELAAGTATLPEIAERTGVSRKTVSAIRDEMGIPAQLQRITPAQRAAAIALASASIAAPDPAEIAVQVGAKPVAVRRILIKEGIIVPATTRRPAGAERLALAQMHLEDGASYREVSRTTGIGVKTLIRHFPDMGSDRDNRALLAWINARADIRELYVELNRGLRAVA